MDSFVCSIKKQSSKAFASSFLQMKHTFNLLNFSSIKTYNITYRIQNFIDIKLLHLINGVKRCQDIVETAVKFSN